MLQGILVAFTPTSFVPWRSTKPALLYHKVKTNHYDDRMNHRTIRPYTLLITIQELAMSRVTGPVNWSFGYGDGVRTDLFGTAAENFSV